MDKHLCCTFSWKIHDGGIRKLIVNSWEETYTQQNGSTVAILLSGKWGILRCHVCQKGKWLALRRHLLMGPSWFITIYWVSSSPRRFGRWPLPFYSFTYHKSICSPSSVYQHRFSSKILKPNLLVNSPPLFGASQRCGSWWASEWCSSTSCAARVFCGRRTFQIGRCERTVMAEPGWAPKYPRYTTMARDFPIGFSSTAPYLIKNLGAKAQDFIIPDLSWLLIFYSFSCKCVFLVRKATLPVCSSWKFNRDAFLNKRPILPKVENKPDLGCTVLLHSTAFFPLI